MDHYVFRLALVVHDRWGAPRRNPLFVFAMLLVSVLTLAGCELIGDIFQAGVWVGVILVVLVIGGIVWFLTKAA